MARTRFLEQMRRVLINRRDAILESLAGELSQFSTAGERQVGDVLDAAVDSDYGEINANLAEVESRELAKIEAALKRIEDGTYGTCQGCGKRIPQVRLRALPFASHCIKCQVELDRKGERARPEPTWWNSEAS